MTTDDGRPDGGTGSAAGDPEPGQASRVGDPASGEFDAGDFVVDHDADPPEEVQPTTTA